MSDPTAWQDTALPARERAVKLVEAMTLEQKVAQLHGAMETIDIYAVMASAESPNMVLDQGPWRVVAHHALGTTMR